MLVTMKPGAIALTRTACRATSIANVRVSCATAAFVIA